MKKLLIAVALMALIAGPSFAQTGQVDSQTYGVEVTIDVEEEASMWADASASLALSGANPENSDAVASNLYHINNIPADISVSVDGNLNQNTNFFIFDTGNTSTAYSAIQGDANSPAGALVWTAADMGVQKDFGSVAQSNTVSTHPVVYAADAPNVLPNPQTNTLVVTWTIAPQ